MSPHRAAMILTTPNHPAAYFVYGAQVALGILLTVGVIGIDSLSQLLLLPVAGLIMGAGGAVGAYAITVIPKAVNKDPGLRLEQVAAWVVGVINGLFMIALSVFYSWNTAVPTKIYVGGLAAACVARAVQIRRQRYRLRASMAELLPASPPLAERPDPDR